MKKFRVIRKGKPLEGIQGSLGLASTNLPDDLDSWFNLLIISVFAVLTSLGGPAPCCALAMCDIGITASSLERHSVTAEVGLGTQTQFLSLQLPVVPSLHLFLLKGVFLLSLHSFV